MATEAGEEANALTQPSVTGVTRRLALNVSFNTNRQSAESLVTAQQACEPCRQRKAKCDEGQPQCGRCSRLRLACHYKELSMKCASCLRRNEASS
jgi:hypothetical protein